MTSQHYFNKERIRPLRKALYDFTPAGVRREIEALFAPDAAIHLAHPFETLAGTAGLMEQAFMPLYRAFPDLERRDYLVMAGVAAADNDDSDSYCDSDWVGCCGYYTGTFMAPFLDIPPTGHQASMRFHEFYRFEDGKVVEMQSLWDIPEVMMQAGVWPMSPSMGREWLVPGPASADGLFLPAWSKDTADASVQVVLDMLSGLGKFATSGAAAMELDKFWHPHFSWYGPSGIGTGRGISGFRNWHQIPFLAGMPDRGSGPGQKYFFGDNDYVGVTAWPGMAMTVSGDGFLGIVPADKKITMRSLYFWRCENGLIRENWVLVDLLHVYNQLGVDVLARMRAMTSANPYGPNRGFFEVEPS